MTDLDESNVGVTETHSQNACVYCGNFIQEDAAHLAAPTTPQYRDYCQTCFERFKDEIDAKIELERRLKTGDAGYLDRLQYSAVVMFVLLLFIGCPTFADNYVAKVVYFAVTFALHCAGEIGRYFAFRADKFTYHSLALLSLTSYVTAIAYVLFSLPWLPPELALSYFFTFGAIWAGVAALAALAFVAGIFISIAFSNKETKIS